jgi:group I intron endonuclease
MIIYKIENKINGKIYIGQTKKDLYERISNHLKPSNRASRIGNALRKYGLQSFNISIIDETDLKEILNEKERYWIKFYDCKSPNGYNFTDGGEGSGGHVSPMKGRPSPTKGVRKSEEGRKNIAIANCNPEKCRKQSEKMVSKNPSQDLKVAAKISKALSGKSKSEEHRKNLSLSKRGKPGPRHSPKTKRKISKSRQGKSPWNKGLTKETDERLRETGLKISKSKLYRNKMIAELNSQGKNK